MTSKRTEAKRPYGMVRNLEDVRARSQRDNATGCWNWAQPTANGRVRLWAIDLDTLEKRNMNATVAVWSIAYGSMPRGLVYHTCCNARCVNWAHLALSTSRAAVTRYFASRMPPSERRIASRAANLEKARAAQGIRATPDDVVRTIRSQPPSKPNSAIARELGLSRQRVWDIRNGVTRAAVNATPSATR